MHKTCTKATCTIHLSLELLFEALSSTLYMTMVATAAVSAAIVSTALAGVALDAADFATIRGGGLCVKEHWVGQRLVAEVLS